MRVLVTGSSGRVGSAISRRVARSHDVIGLDLRSGDRTSVVGDLCDRRLVRGLLSGVDAVIHTASLHAPDLEWASDRDFIRVNVDGTGDLIESCLELGVTRFVYTSTTSLYGQSLVPDGKAVWVTEALTPRPRDVYDETKLAAEELCRDAAGEGLSCVSLRMSRCFREPDELVAGYRLHRGVDIRDVADAHLLALESTLKGFDVFNVSVESPFDETDCAELLHDAASVIRRRVPWAEEAFARRKWRLPASIDRVYVVEKARQVLGFRSRFGLLEVLDLSL